MLPAISPGWVWGEFAGVSPTLPFSLLRVSLGPKQNKLTTSLERTELVPPPQADAGEVVFPGKQPSCLFDPVITLLRPP